MIHEKMFESRLFFVDKLIGMGARIVLCDPHRALVAGPSQAARRRRVESPDIRAGMAHALAALCAEGREHDQQRRPDRARLRADRRAARALGAEVERVEDRREVTASYERSGHAATERDRRRASRASASRAFTTTRRAGSFGLAVRRAGRRRDGAVDAHSASALSGDARRARDRDAGARRATCSSHSGGWEGGFARDDADGHLRVERGTAMAVTVADCVPVFIAHPSGAVALLHSGWRGTAGTHHRQRTRGARRAADSAPTSCIVHWARRSAADATR